MTAFVLVPGAWLGGWCWRRLTPALEAAGHAVYRPSLTGLGERAHLGGATVDLDTHIADIVNLLVWEDLREVVLVGHSYAGMVVTGVADRASERLARLVHLDALVPDDGQAFFDFTPPAQRAAIEAAAGTEGGDRGRELALANPRRPPFRRIRPDAGRRPLAAREGRRAPDREPLPAAQARQAGRRRRPAHLPLLPPRSGGVPRVPGAAAGRPGVAVPRPGDRALPDVLGAPGAGRPAARRGVGDGGA